MQPPEADASVPAPLSPAEPPGHPTAPAGPRRTTVPAWLVPLAVALLASVAAWLSGEVTLDYYKPSAAAAAQQYAFTALNREQAIANGRNGALAFGALGGLLGLGLGVAGGLSRRSVSGAFFAGFVGL